MGLYVDDIDRPMLRLMLALADGKENAGQYLMGLNATVPEAELVSPVNSEYERPGPSHPDSRVAWPS